MSRRSQLTFMGILLSWSVLLSPAQSKEAVRNDTTAVTPSTESISSGGGTDQSSLEDRFEEWAVKFNKEYKNQEERASRFAIWAENYRHIQAENSKNQTFRLGMNAFGDMTPDEFRHNVLMSPTTTTNPAAVAEEEGNLRSKALSDGAFNMLGDVLRAILGIRPPPVLAVDWEKAGATSVPIMQGPCGACYAFASVAAIEALEFQQTGYLIPRRVPRDGIDDDDDDDSSDGGGGQFAPAFKYAMQQPLCQSDALHYTLETRKLAPEVDVQCRDGIRINGYSVVAENNEEQLMAAVAKQPVAAQVAFKHVQSWMFLRGGILKYEKCGDAREGAPDHAVLIVGYGTHRDGTEYWKARSGGRGLLLSGAERVEEAGEDAESHEKAQGRSE
eukprot:jgi/Bigna1/86067/estExt_fgenesh1_pg.C_80005